MKNGAIVHAETTGARGRDAFLEIASWKRIEFAYDRTVRPPVETITETWYELLIDFLELNKAPNNEREEEEERRRA